MASPGSPNGDHAHGASTNGDGSGHDGCALVTGASRGIGAAIAERLADDGWTVAVNYSSDVAGAEAVADRIAARGGRAVAIGGDVADPAAVERMFTALESRYGAVLVVVNNAGTRDDRMVTGTGDESWSRVLAVNLGGPFNTTRRAAGPMMRRRFGRIINIGSVAASTPLPGQSAYAASKAGVEGLTRAVAIELGRRGVTANVISPGLVDTGFLPDGAREWINSVPSKRAAEPREVAALASFLASDEAGYVNGAVFNLDGGLSAGIGVLVRHKTVVTSVNEQGE
jgi:3-oxoacyl-[acyl-carrier protein] reductase